MTQTSMLGGFQAGEAIKQACVVASTTAITLSGIQTIDGIAVSTGDRVLVKDQASAIDNGIYVAQSSSWLRAKDCDGSKDLTDGTLIRVNQGSQSGGKVFFTSSTQFNPVIGAHAVNFAVSAALSVSSAVTISPFVLASGFFLATSTAVMRETMNAERKSVLYYNATASKTFASSDHGYLFDVNSTEPITLSVSSAVGLGWHAEIRNGSNFTVTIASPNDVNGSSSVQMLSGGSVTLISGGTLFRTVGSLGSAETPDFLTQSTASVGSISVSTDDDGSAVYLNASTGNVTVALIPASMTRHRFNFVRTDAVSSNTVLIAPNSTAVADLINDATALTLPSQHNWAILQYASTALGWRVLSEKRTFFSSSFAVAASVARSADHGLGVLPRNVEAVFRPNISTGGYSTASYISFKSMRDAASQNGVTVVAGSTSVSVSMGDAIHMHASSGGSGFALGATNWVVYLRAEA